MSRHRLIVCGVPFAAAVALAMVALWIRGLPPTQWWARAQAWWAEREEVIQPPAMATTPTPAPLTGDARASGGPMPAVLPGTQSSIAAQPLLLIGTSPGRNLGEGTALIGVHPDDPQTYLGGAVLANGARLAEIHRDFVVLVRGAASARLPLYRPDAPLRVPDTLLTVGAGAASVPAPAPAIQNVLTEYLRPSPIYDGETLRGYEVYPGRKAAVFARLGLQPGDVVTAINGLPLPEPRQALELLAELTCGRAVTARIERKHTVQTIALDGALILSDQEAHRSAVQAAPAFGAPTG